jgi:precorrin-2/cobalt-factor-2 C20-methyltransferase
MTMGRIICCGLGPGDPDLMSVKADRVVRGASHIAYFRKKGRQGQARRIVEGMLGPHVREYPMEYPVTTELDFDSPDYIRLLTAFYDDWAGRLMALAREADVVVLCEGDPFFYGSFMHLYARLKERVAIEVIAGIPVMTVLTGTLPEHELENRVRSSDALVIMKTGRNLQKVRRALEAAGRISEAWLIERGTMPGEKVARLAEVEATECPYFAIVLVHGRGRQLELAE